MESLFEAAVAVDTFCTVEIQLPQIGPIKRVMPFKANARRLIDETRTVSISATYGVAHSQSSRLPVLRGISFGDLPSIRTLICTTSKMADGRNPADDRQWGRVQGTNRQSQVCMPVRDFVLI
jgi:hypothetical protein